MTLRPRKMSHRGDRPFPLGGFSAARFWLVRRDSTQDFRREVASHDTFLFKEEGSAELERRVSLRSLLNKLGN